MFGHRMLGGALAALIALVAAAPATAARYHADVRRTAYGIPHVLAHDWGSLGYGYGYAIGRDNACTLADAFTTVRAQRTRFFGAKGQAIGYANGTADSNLDSDFYWQSLIDGRTVERLLAQKAPHGPSQRARRLIAGWAAGYDRALKAGVTDPRCKGKPWVRPIEAIDVWRRMYQLAIFASSGNFITGLVEAQPPAAGTATARAAAPRVDAEALRALVPHGGDATLGSNGLALGSRDTAKGDGMLLGNPHFPWRGSERFYEEHLTIPGVIDVEGSALMGFPAVNIGFNRHVAWTHTVSTGWRFTPFQLELVPGDPTSYLVDGKPVRMTRHTVHVGRHTHTFYGTRYGPLVDIDAAGMKWSAETAYALGDANAGNLRMVDLWLGLDTARSSKGLVRALKRWQGDPWVNTIGADDHGNAVYADVSVVPHVTAGEIARCVPAGLGQLVYKAAGIVTLDGSRSACAWGHDAGALSEGTFAPRHLPVLYRRDDVENSNDSFWLANPKHPLTGFSPIIGPVGTEQGLRTRQGNAMVAARMAGTDGLAGRRFTLRKLQKAWGGAQSWAGHLMREQLAALCRAHPQVTLPDGRVVDVSEACPVLAAWDGRANLDSRGAWLFQQWWQNTGADLWADAFDPKHPLTTPAKLADSPGNVTALGLAVANLRAHHVPLDAPVRAVQFGPGHTPVQGCDSGCFENVAATAGGGEGADAGAYGQVLSGSSYVQTVELTRHGPRAQAILTYSQSEDPSSPHFADQTKLFARKGWVRMAFTERAIRRDPQLEVTHLNG